MIERRLITDRAEWLEWRKRDVTASNAGALFGCHPYVTALRLYAEKRGTEFEPPDDSKIFRRGRWLEPAIGKAVGELEPTWHIKASNEYYRDPGLRLGATPDFLLADAQGRNGVLQTKTAAPHIFERDWQGGKEPPLWILLQASVEMMLTEAQFAAVAVMIVDAFNLDVSLHRFERNAAVEQKIIKQVREFWRMVEAGEEPQPDFSRDGAVLRALHPVEERGNVLDLRGSNQFAAMLADRADKKTAIKEMEGAIDKIETEIIHKMGDAEIALADGFKISFKVVSTKEYTVKARSARQLRILDRRT